MVIGRVVPRHISRDDVEAYVGGFTVVHDVSARDWQLERNGGQWLLGKAGDGYAPIGPVVVTTDELSIDQAQNAGIRCRVNGETLQDSNTSNLIHKVQDVIAFVSQFVTLYPGDVVSSYRMQADKVTSNALLLTLVFSNNATRFLFHRLHLMLDCDWNTAWCWMLSKSTKMAIAG